MHPSLHERRALCDLLDQLGPSAPTACEGWATTEMAAHLWTREHRPDAAPGLLGRGPFAGYTERLEMQTANRPYADLVADLRSGPPAFWPGRWLPDADLHEWFLHHEDVRRANGFGPRTDAGDLEDRLWKVLPLWGRILTRRVDVGVALTTPDGRRREVHDGDQTVVLRGRPSELMLRLFGRPADITVEGPDDAREAFDRADIGL